MTMPLAAAPSVEGRQIAICPFPGVIALVTEDDYDTDDAMPAGYWFALVLIFALLAAACKQ